MTGKTGHTPAVEAKYWNLRAKRVHWQAVKARKRLNLDWAWLRSWFMLTADEKKVLAGIVAIVLVGLAARYLHLRNEQPEPYQPAGLEQNAPRGGS